MSRGEVVYGQGRRMMRGGGGRGKGGGAGLTCQGHASPLRFGRPLDSHLFPANSDFKREEIGDVLAGAASSQLNQEQQKSAGKSRAANRRMSRSSFGFSKEFEAGSEARFNPA